MKNQKYRRFLIVSIISLLSFILFFSVITDNKLVKYGYDAFIKTQNFFFQNPIKSISDLSNKIINFNKIIEERNQLKKYQDEYYSIYAENIKLKQEIDRLDKLMNIDNISEDFEKIYVKVLARDVDNYYNYVVINGGEDKKLKTDLLVINEFGLIGRIVKVNPYTSIVRLMSSNVNFNNILVQITNKDNQNYDALLEEYDKESGMLVARMLDEKVDIELNSLVTTNNFGNVYPKNIYIGKVKKIENLKDKIGKTLFIESDVNFNDLGNLIVVKSK